MTCTTRHCHLSHTVLGNIGWVLEQVHEGQLRWWPRLDGGGLVSFSIQEPEHSQPRSKQFLASRATSSDSGESLETLKCQ